MIKFEIGKTYFTRSIGDSNATFTATIVSRTAKTVKTDAGKTFRVSKYNGAEFFMPEGRYSMAPTIRADRVQA
jgi:hypothetical protein